MRDERKVPWDYASLRYLSTMFPLTIGIRSFPEQSGQVRLYYFFFFHDTFDSFCIVETIGHERNSEENEKSRTLMVIHYSIVVVELNKSH